MRHRKGHRRKGFGFGPVRFNMGEMMAMNPPEATGVLAGFKPANITGVVPIMAGYVANAMVTKFLAGKIPMTKAGIGNYVLGLGSAGLIGALAGSIDKNVGKGMFIGAVVEPIGRAVSDVASKGVGALSLSGVGWDNPNVADFDEGIAGLEDFTTPTAIAKALPTESTMSQYSLPAATAQAVRQEANVLREIITDDEMAMAM